MNATLVHIKPFSAGQHLITVVHSVKIQCFMTLILVSCDSCILITCSSVFPLCCSAPAFPLSSDPCRLCPGVCLRVLLNLVSCYFPVCALCLPGLLPCVFLRIFSVSVFAATSACSFVVNKLFFSSYLWKLRVVCIFVSEILYEYDTFLFSQPNNGYVTMEMFDVRSRDHAFADDSANANVSVSHYLGFYSVLKFALYFCGWTHSAASTPSAWYTRSMCHTHTF